MEGIRHRSEWIPTIERHFEWSRLEGQLLTTAYERALPVARIARRELLSGGPELAGSGRLGEPQSHYGTGG
jgi:hypothetical protein